MQYESLNLGNDEDYFEEISFMQYESLNLGNDEDYFEEISSEEVIECKTFEEYLEKSYKSRMRGVRSNENKN